MTSTSKRKVLIVDDDPLIQSIVSKALVKNGYEALQAVTGKQAIEQITANKPDILILDVILPDMDGTDIAGMLQERYETGDIPIIYLTSLADKEQTTLGSDHNPDIVMTKPVDVKALVSKLHEISDSLRQSERQVFQSEAVFQEKGSRKRILVVDDDQYILDLLKNRLSHNGFNVLCAVNGKNAVLKAKQHLPDLIILDIMLPGIDGTEVARILREDETTQKIPIIYVTALKSAADELSPDSFGHSAILAKPFDSNQLIAKINELI